MISNERQYRKSLRDLADFQERLDVARQKYGEGTVLFEMQAGQIRRYIDELQQSIGDYDQATKGHLAPVLASYNPRSGKVEVARALVRMRLAKGLTQEELAQQVGTHQPSITRWENEEYDSYRLGDLKKLAKALGRELDVVFVEQESASTKSASERRVDEMLERIFDSAPTLKNALTTPEAQNDVRAELKRVFRLLAEEVAVADSRGEEVG